MNKQEYHKPEFRLYGNISAMTQNTGTKGSVDGGGGVRRSKTS